MAGLIRGVAVALGVMVGCAQAAEPVVMMTWGGVWQKTFSDLGQVYAAKTGQEVKIVTQPSADAGLARLLAQKARPEIDIWTPNMVNYTRALKAGVIERVDFAALANASSLPDRFKLSHGVVGWVSQRGIFYRKDIAPFAPTRWQDLWDPRLAGKLAAPSSTFDIGYFPVTIALANGGSITNMDAAFVELSKLKKSATAFYASNVQSIRMLESGEVAVIAWGVLPNVIQYLGPDSKYAFVIPKPAMVAETPFTLVSDAPRRQAAIGFINFLLAPESQSLIASAFGSLPANPKAKIPDQVAAIISDASGAYAMNYHTLADNLDKIVERYEREVMAR